MARRTERAAAGACPCGSPSGYTACCGPRHDGSRPAETALALMRSRYSAYVLQRADYLLATWDPETRPERLEGLDEPRWLRLTIEACDAGGPEDETGTVRFVAVYQINGRAQRLHEHSSFRRVDGRWYYSAAMADPAGRIASAEPGSPG